MTGGDSGSFSSGIESCMGAVPLVTLGALGALGVLVSIGDSRIVPFGASLLGRRARLGESALSTARGACWGRLRGDLFRSGETTWASRSFDLPLPNPLNAELRLDDDLRSGEVARPYG